MNLRPFRHTKMAESAPVTQADRVVHWRRRNSIVVLVVVAGGLFGIYAAFAYFTTGGSGSGSATAGTLQAVTASGAVVSNLIPDGTAHNVTLTVSNPNAFAVTLKSVTGNGTITAGNGCSPTGVTFTNQTSLSQSIPGGNVATPVTLSGAATMANSSASACQGTTFTIPVTISVQK